MKIVFFGTSEFGAIVLKKLVQANLSPVLVVTTPDKPAGRKQLLTPPPVKLIAEKFKLPIFQPTHLVNSAMAELTRQKIDMFIVAAYGKILPKEILDIPKYGALNVHPSLLPKYRGASPIQTAILNGEDETGVTIILMDEKVDHGEIISNSKFLISNKITYLELQKELAEKGANLLLETIPKWIKEEIKAKAQDETEATYTKIIKKEDGRIDWSKEAVCIERQVRALNPWPGTYTLLDSKFTSSSDGVPSRMTGQILKILKAEVIKNMQGQPGKTFLAQGGKLGVYTGRDALLIEELQLEGGRPMNSKDFLLGHRDFIGNQLI